MSGFFPCLGKIIKKMEKNPHTMKTFLGKLEKKIFLPIKYIIIIEFETTTGNREKKNFSMKNHWTKKIMKNKFPRKTKKKQREPSGFFFCFVFIWSTFIWKSWSLIIIIFSMCVQCVYTNKIYWWWNDI